MRLQNVDKLPSLEDLKVFRVAAHCESFSIAADQLGVSPAYISKRIKLLEDNVGVILFFRAPRSVHLTEQGKIVLNTSEQLLIQLDKMQAQLRELAIETKGLIRVGCSSGFGATFLSHFIAALKQKYQQLNIDLYLNDKPSDLIEDNLHLDIRIGGSFPPQYIAKKIANNHRILCASPSYVEQHGKPIHPSDLESKHVCIGIRERDTLFGSWKLGCHDESLVIMPNTELIVNNGHVAKLWCQEGQGIILRSIWDVEAELKSGQLIQLLPQWKQEANVYAVYHQKTSHNANLRTFLIEFEQFLATQIQSDLNIPAT